MTETCARCNQEYTEGTRFCPEDGSELMMTMVDPLIGTSLPRRYRILAPLGRGSMSVVYKGSYEPLDQPVAIKMLKSHLVDDIQSSRRFQQEIKTAGAMNHPNIVGILDFGVTERGVPYLIMEYLEGLSLGEILKKEGRIPVSRAIKLFTQAADALAYAHREFGVIHRDIKPNNIMLVDTKDETDVVKIVDFGIAKVQQSGTTNRSGQRPALGSLSDNPNQHTNQNTAAGDTAIGGVTFHGELLGTPLYMSPEQSTGKELDGRSDIYSLGCVLYHALTGKPPFMGDTILDTIRMQISSTPQSIEQARPDLFFPERLQQLITKCLAKDPRVRYQRMEHLSADLEACGRKGDSLISSGTQSMRSISSASQPALVLPPQKFELPVNVPILCGVLAVIATTVTVSWGVLTNVGKKENVKIVLPLTPDAEWKQTYSDANAAFESGNYGEAETQYKEAMKLALRFPQPDAHVATTLNHLSVVYDNEDRLEEADRISRQALGVEAQLKPEQITLTADTNTNLSLINCQLGNLAAAEAFGRRALELRKADPSADPHGIASSLQALAQVECAKQSYPAADAYLTEALTLTNKAAGYEGTEVASILHDLGMIREKQNNFKGAELLFNRALGIRQKQLGVEHPAVADTLCALGTLNFNMHKDTQAEHLLNSALEIRQKALGEDTSRTAEVYACLAILYDSNGKFSQAEECYRKTLEIRQKLWGGNNPRLLRSVENLAQFLRQHNQIHGAEVYDAQAKRIRAKAEPRKA